MGPHGGVVWALLSDGRRLIWLDASRGARQQGPATAAQIDAWLGLPLQLEVAQLTALLWGELEVPATAQLCAGPQQLEARWQTAAADFCAGIDAVDGRLRRLQRLPRQATQLAASLTIEAIGPQGPARRWQATLGRGDTALQVQVRLRDLQCEPPPATELFSL